MKRLNPKTGKPFKLGEMGHPFKYRDTKEVTRMFKSYQKILNKHGFFSEIWTTPKEYEENKDKQNKKSYEKYETNEGHLKLFLSNAKHRSKKLNLNFDLDIDYLKSIQTDKCPVFGTQFIWGLSRRGNGGNTAATIDRIIPEFGYVKENIVFISDLANRIKTDATEVELYAVADWLHQKRKEVLNAFKNKSTPVPAGHYSKSEEHTKHGIVPAAGAWENNYDANHHRGAVYGEDPDHSAQAGSGDSVAHRNRKVEPSRALESREDDGDSVPEVGGTEFTGRRVFD